MVLFCEGLVCSLVLILFSAADAANDAAADADCCSILWDFVCCMCRISKIIGRLPVYRWLV